MESERDLIDAVRKADCVVIITNHSSFDYEAVLQNARLIVDTRNALGKIGRESAKVFRL
jgi:UDP-N-acetyl-D-glucosamine dehydrogenase